MAPSATNSAEYSVAFGNQSVLQRFTRPFIILVSFVKVKMGKERQPEGPWKADWDRKGSA